MTRAAHVGPVRAPAEKSLPEHARHHNRILVLRTLVGEGPRSRADLARDTGITRVTISDLVADLIADGLVMETGLRAGPGPGKPSMILDLDRHSSYIVGIDVSDDLMLRGALLTLGGEIVHRVEWPMHRELGAAVLADVLRLAVELVGSSPRPVLGVGVASPGIVDADGRVLSAPNLRWTRLDLAGLLREATGVPCHVSNDADLAALAERAAGGASADLILVRIGLGVGAGVLLDGRIRKGRAFAAGEIGHVVVGTDGGPGCVCGKSGCLETWLSVPHLTAALAGAADDRARLAVLTVAGERLGIALSPVIGALDVHEIVLNGPAGILDGPLAAAALATIRARTMSEFHSQVDLRMSTLGSDATLSGAAALVLEAELGVS
jgi:predicted NBD/HSP70 family sugar kinase